MPDKSLPVWAVMEDVLWPLRLERPVVLTAPTGSGKSTQVPQALRDSGMLGEQLILVVEPRRVACRALARRVAAERSESLGEEVGYLVRYDGRISRTTKLCFVTDGVLMRLLENDALLSRVGAVIFDEFHERRMLMDLALGLVKKARERRQSLRLLVMSATIETGPVAQYLHASVVEAQGMMHPVEIHHASRPTIQELPCHIAERVATLHTGSVAGDILVFLPGKDEIRRTEKLLSSAVVHGTTVLPLHSELPREAQDKVFEPVAGRKIILATNVAETSLTIPGVRIVVDGGYVRETRFDARRGITRLELDRGSVTAATQRAGRAGREAPGLCIRLWKEREELALAPLPEIQRADVASVVLTLASIGVTDPASFDFLDAPSAEQLRAATKLLRMLGALDAAGALTPIGWRMVRLPIPPRYARMVAEAERSGCLREVAGIAAILAGPPLFLREAGLSKAVGEARLDMARDDASDLLTFLEVFRRAWEHQKDEAWFEEHHLNRDSWLEVQELRRKIVRAAIQRGSQKNIRRADRAIIRRCIAMGLLDRLARRERDRSFRLATGLEAELEPYSVVQSSYIVVADVRVATHRGKESCVLALATRVDAELLPQLAPHLLRRHQTIVAYFPHTRTVKIREERTYLELQIDVVERFCNLVEASQIEHELRYRAIANGYELVQIEDAAGRRIAVMDNQRVHVKAPTTGLYWSLVKRAKGSPPSVHPIWRSFDIPLTPFDAESLAQRVLRTDDAVNRVLER